MSDAKAGQLASREPMVRRSMSKLTCAVNELESVADSLGCRIEAVVTPELPSPPSPGADKTAEVENKPDLVIDLDELESRISRQVRFLANILERVEL